LHAVVPDLGMFRVGNHLEREEVAEVETRRFLESLEHAVGRPGKTEVHVLRRARSLESKLENETALENDSVSEHRDDAREKPVEDEKLSAARELGPALGGCPQSLLECLLEALRRSISAHGQVGSPPKGFSDAFTSARSARATIPRLTACRVAWRSSSGDIPSRAQSFSVLAILVTGTTPNQARSGLERSVK
jgi:hypothetical protein